MPQGNGEVLQVHQNNSSSPSRPHVPLLLLYDHLYLLQQFEPGAQQGASPHIRSMATVHTPHLPSFGKSIFTSHFTAASSADVWPAKLQYQQWSFGSVLAEKKAARGSSLERLSFLGRKCLFTFSPYLEHRVLSLRAQPQSSVGCP